MSVSNKEGIVDFARELASMGVEIVSTGGTARLLRNEGIEVTDVSDVTGFPEMLDGRVKTLHPHLHAGILARRDISGHMEAIESLGIKPIDLVIINLYPFKEAVLSTEDLEDIIENIDIGGPSLIRAAAKNYRFVAVLTSPTQYQQVIEELKGTGKLSDETRQRLMAEAFVESARYESMIASVMSRMFLEEFPATFPLPNEKLMELRYGENPHQRAAFYADPFAPPPNIAKAEQLHGKQLSFNNILDIDKALDIALDFERPTAVIMKHTNPCGLASADNIHEAFVMAYAVDPKSAYGCVICLNRVCPTSIAEEIRNNKYFVEAIVAPDFEEGALEILMKRKNLRVLRTNCLIGPENRHREMRMKKVQGGLLVQTDNGADVSPEDLKVVTKRSPTEEEMQSMLFAWKLVKHVWSNAVVFVKGERAIGIGAGQMSRVDSAMIARIKGGDDTVGSVMASDAFFPFRDGVDEAAKAGVTAIIQPGGSIRDQEVIDAADEYGMAMVFTGYRVFRH
ncbi:MAG: phosphoribosylaminoimidazolecarboxamide formyltransferase / cyclohydrolase [Candidatus Methanomethylophilaceae archaeon]|nr:phosphoribosylaminoimidazolecarboxamide formyltransferase / cyclohydrolase [Candidatus Methanomethylophilaceae archaeon]MDI3541139.1 phosphoribosylaminoimidazolecarboxamide formyltransferase / cyclohydrolase [Candidatus Methanomethylophilaceae archaeon]